MKTNKKPSFSYTFIQPGKNDSLCGSAASVIVDVGGETYHVAETSGMWKGQKATVGNELDIAYKELQPNKSLHSSLIFYLVR